ncbi:MAG TPA: SRPBCC domain-containing protein [Conexibacter sp.]|nr:SRPBCC domain-containing protein [Conexibacter sp.]
MSPVDTDTLRVERTYDAPPEAVFDAWTNPEVLRRWWKTSDAGSVPVADVDLRVGGGYRLSMLDAEGEDHTVFGEYREVERPHRLVYSWTWEGTGPTAGHESLVVVTFNQEGDGTDARTTVVIEHSNFMSTTSREAHGHGWAGALDSLAREVFPTR